MEDNDKQKRIDEQKQKLKKFAFVSATVILGIVIMLFIFQPSENTEEQQAKGVNTNIPTPEKEDMDNDKRSIYQKSYSKKNKKDDKDKREQMMMDIHSYMNGGKDDTTQIKEEVELDLINPKEQEEQRTNRYANNPNSAYRNINHTLENLYQSPDKANVEREQMKAQIAELQEQLEISKQATKNENQLDDQMALLEKSYELASKHNSSVQTSENSNTVTSENKSENTEVPTDKAKITAIGNIPKQIVSMLHQPISDSTFIAKFTQEHNNGFNTAVGTQNVSDINTIKACINDTKSVINGENVRLRLLEAMRVGRYIIPKNTLLSGVAQMAGERLMISITSIEYKGMIIHVDLAIFDTDGQEGVFIPNSMEVNALKEIGANMGSTLGSSINISTDAGAQLVSDVGKGLIQGTSKYITKKIQIVKVHLKADYKVLLYQKKD